MVIILGEGTDLVEEIFRHKIIFPFFNLRSLGRVTYKNDFDFDSTKILEAYNRGLTY